MHTLKDGVKHGPFGHFLGVLKGYKRRGDCEKEKQHNAHISRLRKREEKAHISRLCKSEESSHGSRQCEGER